MRGVIFLLAPAAPVPRVNQMYSEIQIARATHSKDAIMRLGLLVESKCRAEVTTSQNPNKTGTPKPREQDVPAQRFLSRFSNYTIK